MAYPCPSGWLPWRTGRSECRDAVPAPSRVSAWAASAVVCATFCDAIKPLTATTTVPPKLIMLTPPAMMAAVTVGFIRTLGANHEGPRPPTAEMLVVRAREVNLARG